MPNNTLEFKKLAPGKRDCYYNIEWKADLPYGHRIFLCVGNRDNFVDITKGFTRTELFPLTRCFRKLNRWNQSVDCWLEGGVAPAGAGNVTSNILPLTLPVQPFCGPLTTRMIANDPVAFTYTGTGVGRYFDFEKLDGCAYYFKYGSALESDTRMRGLDCTTFPRALFELNTVVDGETANNNFAALNLAADLGATNIGIEAVSRTQMYDLLFGFDEDKNFVRWPREGLYILWTTGHIMLYRGDKAKMRYGIHEFTGSGARSREWKQIGYKETCILNRTFFTGNYWARKIPSHQEWRVVNTTLSDYFVSDFPEPVSPTGGVTIGTPKGTAPSKLGSSLPSTNGSKYTVVSGDSLSAIAGKYYGDVLLWPIIYDANKSVVGPDPNKIVPGQKLTIPSISGYSQSQLTDARNRGRNWR